MASLPNVYKGTEPFVFVSYSHDDCKVVYLEIDWLQERGANVYYDAGINPGSEWSDELAHAIKTCALFLYFITPQSVLSENCRRELNFAIAEGRRILAVHLDETVVPDGLRLQLDNRQSLLKASLGSSEYQQRLAQVVLGIEEAEAIGARPATKNRSWTRSALGVLVLLFVGAGAWFWNSVPSGGETRIDRTLRVTGFKASSHSSLELAASDLTEGVRGHLSGYQELRLLAGAGDGASYELSGVYSGSRADFRVRVQLVRAHDDHIVWSETFSPSEHVLGNDQLIARGVRQQIIVDEECETIKLKSASLEAAEYVCAALALNYGVNQGGGNDPSLMKTYSARAIELDESLADAHWSLSVTALWDSSLEPAERVRVSLEASDRALELEPDNPKMVWMRSWRRMHDFDYQGAEPGLRRALDLDPLSPWARWYHAALGELQIYRGDLTSAAEHYRRAIRVFDADARIYSEFAILSRLIGDPEGTIRYADVGLTMAKSGSTRAILLSTRMRAELALGMQEKARQTADDAVQSIGEDLFWFYPVFYASTGRHEEARALLVKLETSSAVHEGVMAESYVALGDFDSAFRWLNQCFLTPAGRIFTIKYLRTEPLFEPLKDDPRWEGVLAKLEARESGHNN